MDESSNDPRKKLKADETETRGKEKNAVVRLPKPLPPKDPRVPPRQPRALCPSI